MALGPARGVGQQWAEVSEIMDQTNPSAFKLFPEHVADSCKAHSPTGVINMNYCAKRHHKVYHGNRFKMDENDSVYDEIGLTHLRAVC